MLWQCLLTHSLKTSRSRFNVIVAKVWDISQTTPPNNVKWEYMNINQKEARLKVMRQKYMNNQQMSADTLTLSFIGCILHQNLIIWNKDIIYFVPVEQSKVNQRCLVPLSFGKHYVDKILCDVVPMYASHLLPGRPWQFDCDVTYRGKLYQYVIQIKDRWIVLLPLAPKPIKKRKHLIFWSRKRQS